MFAFYVLCKGAAYGFAMMGTAVIAAFELSKYGAKAISDNMGSPGTYKEPELIPGPSTVDKQNAMSEEELKAYIAQATGRKN